MFQTAGSDEAATAARRALEHARDDVDLRARALLSLSIVEGAHQTPHATEARALLEAQPNPNPELLAWAIIEQISGACLAGNGVDRGELDRAIALERSIGRWRSDFQVATIYPVILRWIDECEAALDALDELGTLADDEGDESLTPYILGHTASALIALGRFPAAADVAERHLSHAEATRQGGQRLQALQMCAHAALFLGALDRATAQASEVLEAAIQVNDTWVIAGVSGILGAAELWRGRPEPARDHLDRWHRATAEAGVAEPGVWRFHADHVEALLACGDREVAQRRTDDLRAAAERAGRRSALAMAHRCDAMLSAHDGDLRGALDHVDGVLQYDAKAVNDFERGRALLLRGTVHRRLKEKSAARTALRAARDGFQATGAAGWVVVTDGEIDRIGRPSSDPFTLTDTERRVAELAAQGLTNREVAERAFMSAKTVEANLAKVYRKLGIRSRAELGACMARSVP
jgi:DNA-binding CsgD family transcriptional regulator